CVCISTAHYGKLHHKNGPANAFRHALWNFMIVRACRRYSGEQRALSWAGKITHWHEDSFPNGKLARAMDLHNNAVGRDLLGEHRDRQLEGVVEILKGMALESVKVDVHANLGTLKYQFEHIMEPCKPNFSHKFNNFRTASPPNWKRWMARPNFSRTFGIGPRAAVAAPGSLKMEGSLKREG